MARQLGGRGQRGPRFQPPISQLAPPLPLRLLLVSLLALQLLVPPTSVRAWAPPLPSLRPSSLRQRARIVMSASACGLGFDFGTSGVRINVLDSARRGVVFEAAQPWPHPEAVKVRPERGCLDWLGMYGFDPIRPVTTSELLLIPHFSPPRYHKSAGGGRVARRPIRAAGPSTARGQTAGGSRRRQWDERLVPRCGPGGWERATVG